MHQDKSSVTLNFLSFFFSVRCLIAIDNHLFRQQRFLFTSRPAMTGQMLGIAGIEILC